LAGFGTVWRAEGGFVLRKWGDAKEPEGGVNPRGAEGGLRLGLFCSFGGRLRGVTRRNVG
jgi:hypothetical protein